MGQSSPFRDFVFVALLIVIIGLLYVITRQNEHDVAKRMQEVAKAQQEQDVSVRGVRDAVQQQGTVLREILAELKKPGRAIVVGNGSAQTTQPAAATTAESAIPDRDKWESAYADPKAEEGGTLFRAFPSDPGTLNPLTENDATVSDVHEYVSESLATRDYKNPDVWIPAAASSWESTQVSLGTLKQGNAQVVADKLNAGLPADVKQWLKAGTEKDGRLRLELAKQGDAYWRAIEPLVGGADAFIPVQWVTTRFKPDAGDKDIPGGDKVLERFEALAKSKPELKLDGPQAWLGETGFVFRVPGDKNAAESIVKEFLAQKEQLGPNGPVWEVAGTETFKLEDRLFYTFHLRPGVTWHDGVPLSVKDYVFSFNAMKDPGVDCQPTRNYYQDCETLEALNDTTIRFSWRKLFAGAFTASAALTILPEHVYRYKHANELNTNPRNKEAIGTGPYKLKEWLPKQRIVLERNENYWGKKPNFKQVFFRIISETAVRLQMLKDKKLDFSGLSPVQWQNDVPKPPFGEPGGLVSQKQWTTFYSYLGWNARLPRFSDKRVRRALTLSIDRAKILKELLYGHGAVVSGTFFHVGPYTDQNIKPWPFDAGAAAELFAAAGWKDTNNDGFLDKNGERFDVKIRYPAGNETGKKILIAVQSDLKKAGINCELDPIEWSVFLDRVKKRQFDAMYLGWSLGWDPDPYQLWHSSQTSDQGSNHSYFVNKEADEIIERLRTTFDVQERIRLCHRFHAILHDEQPYTFLFNNMALFAHNVHLKNPYLPLSEGEKRELFLPLINEHIFSKYWWMPKAQQRSE